MAVGAGATATGMAVIGMVVIAGDIKAAGITGTTGIPAAGIADITGITAVAPITQVVTGIVATTATVGSLTTDI